MDERETKALMDDVAAVMRALVAKATKPLIAKIDALEAKIAGLPAPMESKALAADIAPFLPDNTEKNLLPLVNRICDLEGGLFDITEATQKAQNAQEQKLAILVEEKVGSALAAREWPENGKDGRDGEQGTPGAKGDTGAAGKDGQDGKDGIGLAGAMIDRTGTLILTLSDGTTRELGHVVGKDADMVTVKGMIDEVTYKAVAEAVAKLPVPKDGRDGADGKDGAPGRDGKDADPITKDMIVEAIRSTDAIEVAVKQHLEANPPPAGKDGRDGIDGKDGAAGVDGKDGAPGLNGKDGRDGVDGKDGAPGKDGEKGDPGPAGEKGDRGDSGEPGQAGTDGRNGANGIDGIDGKSVTVEDILPLIDEAVTKAVTLIPVPKDGKDGSPGLNGKDGADGRDGKDGRDGVDVKDLLVVEGGELVATFTDGRTKVLGQFRGKDGEPGKDGIDGESGKDGADGIGFDDLTEEMEDEGRVIVRRFFHQGQMVKESRIQTKMAIFRGVHDQARAYQPGDMVSRGGSLWHCDAECKGPFNGDNWTLSVKKGRDGRPD